MEMKEKTHASSPSTSGKTHEKTSVIQTRRLQFDVFFLRLVHRLRVAQEGFKQEMSDSLDDTAFK